jgi:hypothetical protein
VRTARTPRPRTPEACPSGHPDRAGRVDTGRVDTRRPPDHWTDVRPADSGRGQGDEWRVRRPGISTVTATATPAGLAQPLLGLPRLRRSGHPRSRAYAARRTALGNRRKEILRCVKRALARELYPLILDALALPRPS